MYSLGIDDYCVLAIDHSYTPGSDFGGDGKVSLTITSNQGKILHFQIVESTGKVEILSALKDIGKRPNVRGKIFIITIDNLAHSADTEYVREMLSVSGALAVVQDHFHVTQTLTSPLNNTHFDFKSGEVLLLFTQFSFRPYDPYPFYVPTKGN
jgi:hypothetical protein